MGVAKDLATIRQVIEAWAQVQPDTAFLISPEAGNSVRFQELRQRSLLLSNMLRQMGLKSGDKVAFLMDNGLLTAQLFLGTMYGGFIAVPLNVRAGAVQLSYMLDHCDAKIVFAEDQHTVLLREALEGVRRDVRVVSANVDGPMPVLATACDGLTPPLPAADDVALLMYSSGSTGKPKAAIHTHSSILAHGRNSIEAHQLTSTDRSLLVLPLYHINAECVTLIPTLLSGGSVVVAHRFVVSKFWDWIDDLQVTWSALVPTLISELVDWDDREKDRRQAAFQRIRFFRSSSAPLSPSLHRQFLAKFSLPLLQAMGSTEGGNVFSNPVPPGKNKIGSPGLAWGFEARIVDRQGVDVPSGESGEVLIRGAALMRGYYKDPEGTAAVMDSDGWLHTGDLARQDEDGYFFIVGRSKELIIKGGVNIAPRQIDEVLESHPAVLEAAAVGVPDRYFGEDAVAFVVLRSTAAANEKELLAFCESRLGHFKTPSRIHFLKELPKGPSGKVQRLRLLDPAVLSGVASTTQSASEAVTINGSGPGNDGLPSPVSSIEQIIAAAWADVLAVPDVDLHTNFFALGGHSLSAIQCLSKLREKLPVVLSIVDFFENSTVLEQADLVRQRLRPATGTGAQELADQSTNWEQTLLQQYLPPPAENVIPQRGSSLPYPLSPAQQRLWFLQQLNPNVPLFNEAEAVRLTGELNVEAMESALNVIVSRHEVLRSTITVIDGVPHAVIHESWPLRFENIDLSALTPGERQAEVNRLLIDRPRALYDLETEPAIRVALLRLHQREHVFILMMHHIICDWSSEGIIWRELSALYGSAISGRPVALPALPVTHGDYATWQHQRLSNTTSFLDDLAFWEEALAGAPALLELPADRGRPPIMSYQGGRLRKRLSPVLTEALRTVSRQEKTSLFTIFAAALDMLLYRYTGSEDILLGIPLADRDQQELQSVIGFLLHTHVLRTKLSADMTFRDLLRCVQKAVLDLYIHRSAPFDQIVRKLQPERNLSYTPLFQVMLNWRDRDQQLSFIGIEGLSIESLMAPANTSKFDLFLFVTDSGDEIWLEMEYSTDLFDEDRITHMLGHYQALLETVAADPGANIVEVPLLTAGERQQIVVDWNQTELSYPRDKCLDELIEEQIGRTPDAVAVVFEDSQLTYRQLGERTNQLAAHLQSLGVGRNTLVALCTDRSLEMVIGLLGILRAGGAYLPLDPTFPPERLAFMLEDAKPLVVLTQEKQLALLPEQEVQVVCLEQLTKNLLSQVKPPPGRESEDLAYVLYTSGSTGKPKGVQIRHRSLVNFLTSMQREPGITSVDTLLAVTTLSFDIAGLELYLPLTVGARMVIASGETARDGKQLLALMQRCEATVMQATPFTWRLLLQSGWKGSPNLKILCGGEAWQAELANDLLPKCQSLWNMYGPTETTIWSSVLRMQKDKPVRIGQPIANTTFYVLDDGYQPVPVGIPGQLHIGGDGLALGYLGRPELTSERFMSDKFSSQPGARLYRTGDRVQRNPDGSIEFLRRIDQQVKLRGFRIELGEIEAALQQCVGVRQCAVTLQTKGEDDERLVAYVVPSDPQTAPLIENLREVLQKRLPAYMIPSAFVVIEKMPLTSNGKVDRKSLSLQDGMQQVGLQIESPEARNVPPRTPLEFQLVRIWEQVLHVPVTSVHDNFINLGGHSLLAARLVNEVNKALDTGLTIPVFFRNPTIEGTARVLQDHSSIAREARLVSLRAGKAPGAGTVFFLSCGVGMCQLVHTLSDGPASFAVIVPLIVSGSLDPTLPGNRKGPSLAELAKAYIGVIREQLDFGPCILVGHSFTGILAFEIAHQLLREGVRPDAVSLLLLDTYAWGRSFMRKLMSLSLPMAKMALETRINYLRSRLRSDPSMASKPSQTNHLIADPAVEVCYPSSLDELPPEVFTKVIHNAMKGYSLRALGCRAVLFRACEVVAWRPFALEHDLGWRGLFTRGLEIVEIPGDHATILKAPHLAMLARQFQERLSAVLANHAQDPLCSSAVESPEQAESSLTK